MSEETKKPNNSKKKESGTKKNDIDETINSIFENYFEYVGFTQGTENLNSLPPVDDIKEVNGKPYTLGVMGFRKFGGNDLKLAIACGKAQVRYISLEKYIALIENMHDPESSTIMLQNFSDQTNTSSSRGQIIARINRESSAISVIQGVTGRIIRGPQDFALFDVYYLDRADMTAFYLAAKAQISNQYELESMIQAYDGWKAFDVPLDPLNPYDH